MDSDDVESDAHSLELIECSFVKRVDAVEKVAWDDGRRWRNVFKSKFGWRLACLLCITYENLILESIKSKTFESTTFFFNQITLNDRYA